MKTKIKKHLRKHLKTVHKHLKKTHHVLTKRKVVKKRKTVHRIVQSVFVLIATMSTGAVAFAIATTKPVINLELQANFKPHEGSPAATTVQSIVGAPDQVGQASWYALGLPAPDSLTCASTTFPRGTYLEVKDLRNGRTVTCLVNDYGPEAWTHRVIDLSRGSFRVLEDLGSGTIPVEIRVVHPAAQPTGFNVTLRNFIGSMASHFTGYSLCQIRHSKNFCDQNRQKTWSF